MIPKPHIRRFSIGNKWQCYSDALNPKVQQEEPSTGIFTIGLGDSPKAAYEMWLAGIEEQEHADLTEQDRPRRTITCVLDHPISAPLRMWRKLFRRACP